MEFSLTGITKRYGALYALRDFTLSADKRQIVGLLGQNGAGKTTTLNILTGYMPADAGTVMVGGYDMQKQPRDAKRLIGYLPERPPLYDEMTVKCYLRFVCELKEIKRHSIAAHTDEIAEKTGLKQVINRRISTLSKGYRQRLGIAQSLCGAPEILVLDEPTIGLDPRQVTEMRGLIRELGKTCTIIFSSHILSEVQQLCSRIIILHEGRKVFDEGSDAFGDFGGLTRLRAVIQKPASVLLPAIRSLDCVCRTETVSAFGDKTELILSVRSRNAPERALFTLLAGLDAPILALSPVRDALEEIFLNVTSGETSAGEDQPNDCHL
ncbi:MAG: ABC transporter ATP-binding protein [Clostridia bacterium]|nr:ABC transporter ATP-binding protein [Clostridia bacterium]